MVESRYDLAVVAPARDEAGNLTALVEQVAGAFAPTGWRVQVVVVDDGSRDGTWEELERLRGRFADLVTRRHARGRGQSAALATGIAAARATLVATLDADLQNDPADLPRMVELLRAQGADLVQGDRTAGRQDAWPRRVASGVGRVARRVVIGDRVRDTGCATRVMRAEVAGALPLDRPGMHRFIPALVAGGGGVVVETAVGHRRRTVGRTKYGTGLIRRGLPGLRDCFVVRAALRQAARSAGRAVPA